MNEAVQVADRPWKVVVEVEGLTGWQEVTVEELVVVGLTEWLQEVVELVVVGLTVWLEEVVEESVVGLTEWLQEAVEGLVVVEVTQVVGLTQVQVVGVTHVVEVVEWLQGVGC